jgi:lipopolysaccharide/colanic/teichoic acid biosynthesis glycosyltransferase
MLKRIFDIFLSVIGLVLLLPLFFIVAILIKVTSKGTVLFCQKRVGRLGKDFILYKFRSMTVCDENFQGEFQPGNLSRITSIGRVLRKTKIDELPQLYNVFIGDMSIVGPRPEVRKWVDIFSDRWKTIHQIRPGITDPASIQYRNEEQLLATSDQPEKMYEYEILPKKLELYEDYIKKQSLINDFCLIIKTLNIIITK